MVFILLALDGVGSVRIFWLSCFYVPRSRWWVALRRRLHGNEASEVVVMYLLMFQAVACDAGSSGGCRVAGSCASEFGLVVGHLIFQS